jgi:hypothetical protein
MAVAPKHFWIAVEWAIRLMETTGSPSRLGTLMTLLRLRSVFAAYLISFLLGCASLSPYPTPITSNSVEGCQAFFSQLEDQVKEAGVREASNFLVPGFPYLRTNRFLSAMKNRIREEKEREEWVQWMKTLDLLSREKEIRNLPDDRVLSLQAIETSQPNRNEVFTRAESCSEKLFKHDKALPSFDTLLASRVDVPDDYSFFRRTIGLYPLMVLPVAFVNHKAQVKARSRFEINLDQLPVLGRFRAYAPQRNLRLPEEEVRALIEESKKNGLAVPLLDNSRGKELAWSFAPILIQDVAAPYDQLGQVVWKGNRLGIDSDRPTLYYYFSHAFLREEPILQINYVVWYSDRAGETPPAIEKGHMDGLTYRVSLNLRGRPFVIDVMNNCGCYHLFAPIKESIERIVSKPFKPDPFVPQWLPAIPPGNRLGMRVGSGWHQVERLLAVAQPPDAILYDLAPYDDLKTLSKKNGETESIFDSKGILKGSERVERFILFSMGIPKIGSMREQGHHAIELIGRTHFDDPYLFGESFVFKEGE